MQQVLDFAAAKAARDARLVPGVQYRYDFAAKRMVPIPQGLGKCVRGCGRDAVLLEAGNGGDQLAVCTAGVCPPRFVPAYCDPANEVRGDQYEASKNLDIKEIAKLMRKAIKAECPGVKASVRIDRYSGGQSIDIRVQEAPFSLEPLIPYDEWVEQGNEGMRPWKERYAPEVAEMMAKVKAIHKRWNRDNSDSMSDYFDVRYYGSVTIDGTSW